MTIHPVNGGPPLPCAWGPCWLDADARFTVLLSGIRYPFCSADHMENWRRSLRDLGVAT